jgi:hypothetical protein
MCWLHYAATQQCAGLVCLALQELLAKLMQLAEGIGGLLRLQCEPRALETQLVVGNFVFPPNFHCIAGIGMPGARGYTLCMPAVEMASASKVGPAWGMLGYGWRSAELEGVASFSAAADH